jgi:hypothetical protein
VIKAGIPDGGAARALVEPGKAIAIYVRKPLPPAKPASTPTSMQIQLADGVWSAEWVTMIGSVVRGAKLRGGGIRTLESPPYELDIALRLKRE